MRTATSNILNPFVVALKCLGCICSLQTALAVDPKIGRPRLCSDVWALGCLAYELCTLRPPFVAANQLALARKIMSMAPAPLSSTYSMELQFLVMKLLDKDPARRPTAAQILNYSPMRTRAPLVRQQCPQLQHPSDGQEEVARAAGESRSASEALNAGAAVVSVRAQTRNARRLGGLASNGPASPHSMSKGTGFGCDGNVADCCDDNVASALRDPSLRAGAHFCGSCEAAACEATACVEGTSSRKPMGSVDTHADGDAVHSDGEASHADRVHLATATAAVEELPGAGAQSDRQIKAAMEQALGRVMARVVGGDGPHTLPYDPEVSCPPDQPHVSAPGSMALQPPLPSPPVGPLPAPRIAREQGSAGPSTPSSLACEAQLTVSTPPGSKSPVVTTPMPSTSTMTSVCTTPGATYPISAPATQPSSVASGESGERAIAASAALLHTPAPTPARTPRRPPSPGSAAKVRVRCSQLSKCGPTTTPSSKVVQPSPAAPRMQQRHRDVPLHSTTLSPMTVAPSPVGQDATAASERHPVRRRTRLAMPPPPPPSSARDDTGLDGSPPVHSLQHLLGTAALDDVVHPGGTDSDGRPIPVLDAKAAGCGGNHEAEVDALHGTVHRLEGKLKDAEEALRRLELRHTQDLAKASATRHELLSQLQAQAITLAATNAKLLACERLMPLVQLHAETADEFCSKLLAAAAEYEVEAEVGGEVPGSAETLVRRPPSAPRRDLQMSEQLAQRALLSAPHVEAPAPAPDAPESGTPSLTPRSAWRWRLLAEIDSPNEAVLSPSDAAGSEGNQTRNRPPGACESPATSSLASSVGIHSPPSAAKHGESCQLARSPFAFTLPPACTSAPPVRSASVSSDSAASATTSPPSLSVSSVVQAHAPPTLNRSTGRADDAPLTTAAPVNATIDKEAATATEAANGVQLQSSLELRSSHNQKQLRALRRSAHRHDPHHRSPARPRNRPLSAPSTPNRALRRPDGTSMPTDTRRLPSLRAAALLLPPLSLPDGPDEFAIVHAWRRADLRMPTELSPPTADDAAASLPWLHSSTAWINRQRATCLQGASSLLILYRAAASAPAPSEPASDASAARLWGLAPSGRGVLALPESSSSPPSVGAPRGLRVRYRHDETFRHLKVPEPLLLPSSARASSAAAASTGSSTSSRASGPTWRLLHLGHTLTRHREVLELSIEFDLPHTVEEVFVIRHSPALLRAAILHARALAKAGAHSDPPTPSRGVCDGAVGLARHPSGMVSASLLSSPRQTAAIAAAARHSVGAASNASSVSWVANVSAVTSPVVSGGSTLPVTLRGGDDESWNRYSPIASPQWQPAIPPNSHGMPCHSKVNAPAPAAATLSGCGSPPADASRSPLSLLKARQSAPSAPSSSRRPTCPCHAHVTAAAAPSAAPLSPSVASPLPLASYTCADHGALATGHQSTSPPTESGTDRCQVAPPEYHGWAVAESQPRHPWQASTPEGGLPQHMLSPQLGRGSENWRLPSHVGEDARQTVDEVPMTDSTPVVSTAPPLGVRVGPTGRFKARMEAEASRMDAGRQPESVRARSDGAAPATESDSSSKMTLIAEETERQELMAELRRLRREAKAREELAFALATVSGPIS